MQNGNKEEKPWWWTHCMPAPDGGPILTMMYFGSNPFDQSKSVSIVCRPVHESDNTPTVDDAPEKQG